MSEIDKIRAQVEQQLARVLNDRASELTPGGNIRVDPDDIFIMRADGERALRELMQTAKGRK